jgi:hypothetical protein
VLVPKRDVPGTNGHQEEEVEEVEEVAEEEASTMEFVVRSLAVVPILKPRVTNARPNLAAAKKNYGREWVKH